jgi:hypothetical protein
LVDDQGGWVLSLRADQNRRAEGEGFVPTLYVKRNLFTVRLRCYGNFANEPTQAALDSGKPLLAAIQPPGFWVENGQPKYLRLADQDELIQRYFELIDRVEIEFFYR